jgi:endonuclease/exonuclease/phosphatase family metal-dependent hydrolase
VVGSTILGRRAWLLGAGALGCAARLRPAPTPDPSGQLRVLTLNLAHGRGRKLAQSSARPAEFYRDNLELVAQLLKREAADVVGLQEAELGSKWAGDFDHVAYLAESAGYPHAVAHAHMNEPGRWRYGTAILSRHPPVQATGAAFHAQARWKKGWSRITIELPAARVDLVCAHLDFSRDSIRLAQADELAATFGVRRPPRVVLGDLNAEADDAPVQWLCAGAGLVAPANAREATHPASGRHIDWILTSSDIRVLDHRVCRDAVSDHRPVVADLALLAS